MKKRPFSNTYVWLLTMAVSLMHQSAPAQAQSIHQLVAQGAGKPVTLHVRRDVGALNADQLAKADLAVVGKLKPFRTYISSNGDDVLTDYEVLAARIVHGQPPQSTRGTPGLLPNLTVTLLGGELNVDGVQVTMVDGTRSTWSDESELLLFLARTESDRFVPYGGAAGIFEIGSGGTIKTLRRRAERDPKTKDVTVDELVSLVQKTAKHK